ncbi:MAG: hypothetical protein QOF27_2012 [Gaiellaceae bacterium]|jgi:hypothetical protein|nr:hypothetical protein [Gaiellaceae bacterium]MDX6440736.1 hypothetical protein [Gaiellaceae bacterium]
MKPTLLVLLIAACALAGTARADGDPASDYLLGTQVFFSIDVKLPAAKQHELVSIVRDANKSGYAVRVALIASPYDLGAVTSLWRKPRQYAKFLGAELQFIYKHRLLVVMPNGFGFNWTKHPSTKEDTLLSAVPVGKGAVGMLDSAVTAVQRLASASGVKVVRTPAAATPDKHGFLHSRALIVLAVIAGLAVAVLLRLALRRKGP